MAKKRTMNELRQTKDTHYVNPTFKAGNQGGDFMKPTDKPAKSTGEQLAQFTDTAGDDFMIKEAKDLIVNNLQNQFYDIIFEAVSDEMNKNYEIAIHSGSDLNQKLSFNGLEFSIRNKISNIRYRTSKRSY